MTANMHHEYTFSILFIQGASLDTVLFTFEKKLFICLLLLAIAVVQVGQGQLTE